MMTIIGNMYFNAGNNYGWNFVIVAGLPYIAVVTPAAIQTNAIGTTTVTDSERSYINLTTVIGEVYHLSIKFESGTGAISTMSYFAREDANGVGTVLETISAQVVGATTDLFFTATTTTTSILLDPQGTSVIGDTYEMSNISIQSVTNAAIYNNIDTTDDREEFTLVGGNWVGEELVHNPTMVTDVTVTGSIFGDSFSNGPNDLGWSMDTRILATCAQLGGAGDSLGTIATTMLAATPISGERYVVLQGGVNNITGAATDPNTAMRAAMTTMTDEAVVLGLDYVVVNIAPFKGHASWNADRHTWSLSYNAWLLSTYGDKVVDMFTVLADPDDTEQLLAAYNSGDDLHPSISGFSAVTDLIASTMTFIDPLPAWTGSDWTKGTGVEILRGVATSDGTIGSFGNMLAQAALVVGHNYTSTYSVPSYTSGEIRMSLGSSSNDSVKTAAGTYTYTATATGSASILVRTTTSIFTGTIDNVSVKRILETP